MKRKSIISLLCLMMATCLFAGCGLLGGEPHVHTFESEWTHDATAHWYEATCDCEDVEVTKINHVDVNNDSLCDVCQYDYDHTHSYQTGDDWTVDCTNHWRAATCNHVVAGTDKAAHADTNEDGKCDTCLYVIKDIHQHVYADGWTSDDDYHWHAAICEHKAEMADKAAHDVNAAGDCIVCGEHLVDVKMDSVEDVLLAAQANNYKISFGDVIAQESVYGGTGKAVLENGKTNRVHFALGNGESYIQYVSFDKNGNYVGQEEQWFERRSEDEVFGVAMLNGEYELSPIEGAAQFLNGYNYVPGSILPSSSNDTSTLANLFVGLYSQMKEGVRVRDNIEGYDPESDKYEFSYTYYSVNTNTSSTTDGAGDVDAGTTDTVTGTVVNSVELEYYNVLVTFSINEDMIIDIADFYVEVYRDFDADRDIAYEWEDNGDGTVTIGKRVDGEFVEAYPELKPTANPSVYTYSVSQMAGERIFTTPYPRAALLPTSFEFNYLMADGNEIPVRDSLILEAGEYAQFSIGDILPKTASSKFFNTNDFEYTFVNKDSDSTARAWYDSDTLTNGFWYGKLKLKIRDIGEYTVTLKCGEVTKVFDLSVVAEKPIVLPEDDENTVNVATTDTNCYIDLYSYTARTTGTYTFTVPAGLGLYSKAAYDKFGSPELDVFNPEFNSIVSHNVSVEIEAGEKYEFYVGAVTKGAWVIKVTKGFVPECVDICKECNLCLDKDCTQHTEAEKCKGHVVVGPAGTQDDPHVITLGQTTLPVTQTNVDAWGVYATFTASESAWYLFKNCGDYGWSDASYESVYFESEEGSVIYIEGGKTLTLIVGVDTTGSIVADVSIKEVETLGVGTHVVTNDGTMYNATLIISAPTAGNYELSIEDKGAETLSSVYCEAFGGFGFDYGELSANAKLEAGQMCIVTLSFPWDENFAPVKGSWNVTFAESTAGGDEGGDEGETTEPEGSEANPYVVTDGFSMVISADYFNPIYVKVPAGVTASIDAGAKFYTDPEDMSTVAGTSVTPDVETVYAIFADSYAGAMCMLTGGTAGSGEESGLEGSGTDADPFVIPVMGDYICAFPGGMNYVFYSYTPSVAGTFTVTILSDDYYWGMGTDLNLLENFGNAKSTYSTAVAANETVYVGISTYSGNAGNVEFAVAFEESTSAPVADGSESNPYALEENNTCEFPGGTNFVFYTYTAKVAGTLTITVTSEDYFWAYGSGAYELENVGSTTSTLGIKVEAGEKLWIGMSTNSMQAGTITFTASFVEGEEEEEETVSYDTVIVEGANVLYFSASEVSADAAERTVTIEKAGNYSFNAGNLFIAGVLDSTGTAVTKNADYTYSLAAGTYTVQFGMLSMFGVSADMACKLNLVWKSEIVVEEEKPDEGGEDSGETGSVVTYMSERHSNGRYLKVEIDAAAGTMILTRSNMSGGWDASTATAEYTYAYADGTVTATNVSGDGCSFTWKADGTPESITWGSATYTGFTLEA